MNFLKGWVLYRICAFIFILSAGIISFNFSFKIIGICFILSQLFSVLSLFLRSDNIGGKTRIYLLFDLLIFIGGLECLIGENSIFLLIVVFIVCLFISALSLEFSLFLLSRVYPFKKIDYGIIVVNIFSLIFCFLILIDEIFIIFSLLIIGALYLLLSVSLRRKVENYKLLKKRLPLG